MKTKKDKKFDTKKKSKIIKLLLNFKFIFTFTFIFLTSFLMVVPGMGIESLMFINSVNKEIKRIFPKNKFLLDGNDVLFEPVVNSSIKKSYIADAVSTINFYETSNIAQVKKDYIEFAKNWFNDRWSNNIQNKISIDLYDVGQDLIKFDKAIATKFHTYGYVHTGIQWAFKDLGDIFSKDIYKNALLQQTILEQSEYENMLTSTGPGLAGIDVSKSIGSYIVNNKVWFLNIQIDSVKYAMNAIPGHGVFENKNLTTQDLPTYTESKDLYHPHFTDTLNVLRAGIIMNFISYGFLIVYIVEIVLRKTKKKGKV